MIAAALGFGLLFGMRAPRRRLPAMVGWLLGAVRSRLPCVPAAAVLVQ